MWFALTLLTKILLSSLCKRDDRIRSLESEASDARVELKSMRIDQTRDIYAMKTAFDEFTKRVQARFTSALEDANDIGKSRQVTDKSFANANALAAKRLDEIKSLNNKMSSMRDTLEENIEVMGELNQTIENHEVEKEHLRQELEEHGHIVHDLQLHICKGEEEALVSCLRHCSMFM